MNDRVGFVILHYGDMTVTDNCVQSILRMEGWEQTLIVIVDNEVQSSEEERESTRRHFESQSNIIVLKNDGNGGFSEANNLGYTYARDEGCGFILMLNNDIVFPQKDFLQILACEYQKKKCHVLAPDIVKAHTQEHQNPLDTRIRTEKEAMHTIRLNRAALALFPLSYPYLRRWERRETERCTIQKKQTEPCENIVPFGACLILTPAFAAEQKEAFCPETMFFYEEYILALRCQKLGYLIRYVPQLKAVHESGAATRHTYHTSISQMKFRLERTRDAAEVYLQYLRSGR